MPNDIQFSAVRGRRRGGVKSALLRGPRTPKRRVSLRVPAVVMGSIRGFALQLDMPITDLCQALIHVAAVVVFLRLQRQEGLEDFFSSVRLNQGFNLLRNVTGGHAPRLGEAGEPVSLRLPAGFLAVLEHYAKLTGKSRSELLLTFLEQGIRIYLLSWLAVTKALTKATSKQEGTKLDK
ncbi:MAG: hypothetical protein ABSC50_13410 [Candidatus Bathyarchaeia archaeon]